MQCRHGFFICKGINKDDDDRPLFTEAKNVAILATKQLILDIEGQLDSTGVQFLRGNANKDIIFVIDTTGSMGDDIAAVKTYVKGELQRSAKRYGRYILLQHNYSTSTIYIWRFVLETFGDPEVGVPYITSNVDDFLAQVEGIVVSGGGDCPELAISGLIAATSVAYQQATVFFFSDASAKDTEKISQLEFLLSETNTAIQFLLTGSCGFENTYDHLAEFSGGQVFRTSTSELPDLIDVLDNQVE